MSQKLFDDDRQKYVNATCSDNMTVATLEGLIRVGGFPNDKPAPPTVFILYPTVNEEEEDFDMNLLGYVSFSFLTKEEMAAVRKRLKERNIETIEDELTKQPPPTREQMGKDLDELKDKFKEHFSGDKE